MDRGKEKKAANLKIKHELDTSECKFECGSCRLVLPTKDELKEHFNEHFEDGRYVCENCGEQFAFYNLFHDHCTQHIIDLYCLECDQPFQSVAELEKHKEIHLCSCDLCPERFSDEQLYRAHMEMEHGIQSLKCEICNRYYKTKDLLRRHKVTVHAKERTKCDLCNKSFSVRKSMLRHLKLHFIKKQFACEVCGDTFNEKRCLNDHMMKHSGDFAYKCPVCSKGYPRKCYLVQHMRSHMLVETGPEFQCELCPKKFNLKCKLTTHMKSHSDNRPHKCDICAKCYKFSFGLKYHMQTAHASNTKSLQYSKYSKEKDMAAHTKVSTTLRCNHCSMHFEKLCDFSKHLIIHLDKNPLACPICQETFLAKDDISIHVEGHFPDRFPRSCADCKEVVKSRSHLDVHICRVQFACSQCYQSFNSKKEMELHKTIHKVESADLPNYCVKCHSLFSSKAGLNKHMRKVHHLTRIRRIKIEQDCEYKQHSCELCGKCFKTPYTLTKHFKVHIKEKEKKILQNILD